MTRAIHILSFILACVSASSQIRPNISKIVSEIAIDNELDYSYVGEAGVTTEQYYRFIDLRDSATYDELMNLICHENNVVRIYAGWSLIDRKSSNELDLFKYFTKNNGEVMSWEGCLGFQTELNHELYQSVRSKQSNWKASKEDIDYYTNLRTQLDSFVLSTKCCESLMRQVIRNNKSNPDRYLVIRELALSDKNKYALIELATYGKSEDIESIMKFKKESFEAVSEYPHADFWPLVEQYVKSERSDSYFKAVAAFENQNAIEVLLAILDSKNISQDEKTSLYEAIAHKEFEGYDDLLIYFFDNYQTIDMLTVRGLVTRKKHEAATSFKNQLNSKKKLFLVDVGNNYGSKDSILYYMIDLISETYPNSMDSICNTRIMTQYFTELTPFLEFVAENNISIMDSLILERLKKERRAYETFHLTETYFIVSKNDDYEMIKSILTTNNDNWNKGNWASHFAELFEKYGLKYTTPATNSH